MARYAEALPALGAGRFQVRRTLGEGGLGVVYEVHDQKRDALLALKSLRRPTPEALTRLKREFRALEELEHPNLVVLDELFEENGDWFFTMELVEGTDFLAYVRRAGGPDNQNARGCDEPRLRLALAQLASGLSALHNAGKIHRDVKPSNVLVTREGRVVLLDFGLVTEIDRAPDWTATHAVGSALYIAPEQAAGRPVGPEADWYAVGAMLYEALTERPIFTGSTLQILTEKQRRVPVSPQLLVPGVPLDLSVLALDLLRIEPDRRPSGPSVQRRVGGAAISGLTRTQSADIVCIDRVRAARTSNVSHQRNTLFVGRESELLALDQALSDVQRGGPVVVVVRGESGIGKSSLIRAFAARAESEGALVLRGRCYEREAVAYKAVDGVVESLAELLRRMSRLEAAAVVPRRASLLLRAFPALTRVSAMVGAGGQEAADPREMRIQLFQAFRELFTRLSEKRRLIIAIDDLQWADPESIALLS